MIKFRNPFGTAMEESGVKTDKHRDDGHGQLKVCKSEEHQEEEATNINKCMSVGIYYQLTTSIQFCCC